MKKVLSKLSDIFTVVTDKKYYRYYGAVLVAFFMVLILAKGMEGTIADSYPTAGVYGNYNEVVDEEELTNLVHKYYELYAAGDTASLETVAYPISEAEKSYIAFFSTYVDSYKDIKLYTKRGLEEGSYLVSVYLNIQFVGINQVAPGLDFFYVETDENGKLYINNVYSSYNAANGDFDVDPQIASLIATFEEQGDVMELQASVQNEFNEAVLSDQNLYTFVNSDLPTLTTQWAEGYQAQVTAAIQEVIKAAEEAAAAQAAAEQAAAEAAALEEAKASATKAKVTGNNINVRESASANSASKDKLSKDAVVYITGTKDDWSEIIYNDTEKGYVKSEFLKAVTAEDEAADNAAADELATLKASATEKKVKGNSINVRDKATKNGTALAKLSDGAVVYVIGTEGDWSKIIYNDTEQGYIKSEFLQ